MRKLFTALCVALFTVVAVPAVGWAATEPTAQELQIIKKKKKLAALKVAAAKKAAEDKLAAIKRKKILAKQQAVLDNARKRKVASSRACGSFMKCLFGSSRNRNVANASFGSFKNSGLSGRSNRRVVDWNDTKYPVGSLIVKTPERALYYVTGSGEAIRYSIGVGREGMQWSGSSRIVSKKEWPGWTPPAAMIEREAAKGHILPAYMEGGPGNPLGARALYIGGTIYRVHGTNNEASIGGAVSSGCIRMMNADVIDLYNKIKIGARIYVYQ